MTPGDRPILSEDPPTARRLVFSALPQLLAPGVVDPKKDWDLLMLLIRLSDAVENFNDKARTYNTAWASAQHPDVQALCHHDLEMTFWDYRDAHEDMLAVIGRLGDPLPLAEVRKLSFRQRLVEWYKWEARRQQLRTNNLQRRR